MHPDRPNMHPHRASGEVINEPAPAHIPLDQYDTESDDGDREATELRTIDPNAQRPRVSRVLSNERPVEHWYDHVRKAWRHQIRISVPHVDCRDHLANERTFLGYLRTSIALSMIGIFIAQLYRLQHRQDPDDVFGYFVLSKPLSVIFQTTALGMVLIGSARFYKQQHAMSIGKVHAGGWELASTAIASFLLLLMLFVLHVALDVYREDASLK